MGLDRIIRFPAGCVPAWDAIKSHLARVGEPAPLRLIDNLPAFPDETPEAGWRELRITAGGGMITIRQSTDAITCTVWSNADAALLAARDRVAWACAASGGGTLVTDTGPAVSHTEFALLSNIHPA